MVGCLSCVGYAGRFSRRIAGVGGGFIIVPSLIFLFNLQHFPESHLVHLALGTSLASIMFTSMSSLRSHHAHGAVNWKLVRRITPGIVIGTLLGSGFAAQLPGHILILFLWYSFLLPPPRFCSISNPNPRASCRAGRARSLWES